MHAGSAVLRGHHLSGLPEAGEESGAEQDMQYLCLPCLQEQDPGPVTDKVTASTASGVCSQKSSCLKPKMSSDRELDADP